MRRLTPILFALTLVVSAWAATPPRAPATAPAKVTPEEAAALHDDITQRYLKGDWETLATDLPQKARIITVMTKEHQADVTYIKQAIAEGRPAWWNQVRQGKKTSFSAKVWADSVTVTYDPSGSGIQVTTTATGGKSVVVGWPSATMDSNDQAEHGFTKGDIAYVDIWSTLESADLYGQTTFKSISSLNDADKTKLFRYMTLRGMITAAYYGTPRARHWAAFLSLDAYLGDHQTAEAFVQRKAFGAMIVQEIVGHAWKYPSFRAGRVNQNNPEGSLATGLMNQFANVAPTFAEEKALRDAVKQFALTTNMTAYTSGKVTLPNKQVIMLNPPDDAEAAGKRNEWLLDKLKNPETKPAEK